MKYVKTFVVLLLLFVSLTVCAEEVNASKEASPSFFVANLDDVIKIVYSLFGMLLSWWAAYRSYKNYQNTVLTEAIEAVEAGIAHSEDSYVEWAKRAKADGKLTKEERAEALKIAYTKALEVAKGPALSLIKSKGPEIINSWIKKIVEKRKAKNADAPVSTPANPS